MTTIVKKLPAILLAVIVAAVLTLAVGVMSQPAYADEETTEYGISVTPYDDEDSLLPGGKVLMEASIYDGEGEDVTGQVILQNPQWTITDGTEYATVAPDKEDPLGAYVTFGSLPEGVDEVYSSVQLTATIGGQTVQSNAYPLVCMRSYYKLVTNTDLDPYMEAGDSEEITGQVLYMTEENPEGTPIDNVTFTWPDFNPDVVTVDPAEATGNAITSTVTRKTADWDFFSLEADWTDESGEEYTETQYFYLEEKSTDLNDYQVEIDSDEWRIFVDEGETYVPEVSVVNGDYELPEDAYDLIVERYKGWDIDTGEEVYEEYCVNMEKPLEVAGKEETDIDGFSIGGTNIFRITAKAKEGSGYTGQTEDSPEYVFLFSNKTLWGYSADIVMKDASGQAAEETYPYFRYEVSPGTTLTPVVSINGTELKAGTDYELTYVNVYSGDETTEFPTELGEYNVTIRGAGEYYGTDESTYVKVGEPNTLTVTAKAVKAKTKKTVKKKAIKVKTNGDFLVEKDSVNGQYSGKAYNKIKVSPAGKVTVKKGLKKGTYKLKVFVYASGDEQYLSAEAEKIIKIKVK